MNVNAIGGASAPPRETTAGPSQLGKDDFLQLMVAQMQHQNPLDPMDGTQFVAQLAQFTSVEQLFQVNQGLDAVAAVQVGLLSGQTMAMIGKEVHYQSDQVDWTTDPRSPVNLTLGADAETVEIELENDLGETFKYTVSDLDEGDHEITYKDMAESLELPPGKYSIKVTAKDEAGLEIPSSFFLVGRVRAVSYTSGAPVLVIGDDTRVNPDQVLEVLE